MLHIFMIYSNQLYKASIKCRHNILNANPHSLTHTQRKDKMFWYLQDTNSKVME